MRKCGCALAANLIQHVIAARSIPAVVAVGVVVGICYSSESRCAAHAKYHRRVIPEFASAQDIYSMLAHSPLTVHVADDMYVCIDVWESMYVYECACVYVCTYVCMSMYMNMDMLVYMYM